MQGIIREILITKSFGIPTVLTIEDLFAANAIVISNSLNGIRRVDRIFDEQSNKMLWEYKEDANLIAEINKMNALI